MSSYVVSTAPETRLPTNAPDPSVYAFSNHINLVTRAEDVGSIRVDGAPVTAGWRMAPVGEYAGTQVSVPTGMHTVSSTKPAAKLLAWVYGWNRFTGYGNPAGMQLSEGNCVPSQNVAGDGLDNDCDGVADEELLDGLDNDGDGLKDEDLSAVHTVNHAPELAATTYKVGSKWTNRLPLNGFDPDGDALTYRIVAAPSVGSAAINGAVLVYTPVATDPSDGTTVTVRVVANDGQADSEEVVLTLRYSATSACRTRMPGQSGGCNDRPFFFGVNYGNTLVSVPAGGSAFYRGRLFAHDFDGDAVTYELVSGPAGFSVDAQSGAMTWAVDTSKIGTWTVRARVKDALGGSSETSWNVVVQAATVGGAPVITSVANTGVAAGEVYSYQVLASDPDGGAITYRLLSGPTAMTVSSTGLVVWPTTLDDNALQYNVVLVVRDAQGLETAQTYNVTVGTPLLEITSTPVLTAVVGQPYGFDVTFVDHTDGSSPVHFDVTTEAIGLRRILVLPGLYRLRATVIDSSGHTAEAATGFAVTSLNARRSAR
jgi:hypothetical protein